MLLGSISELCWRICGLFQLVHGAVAVVFTDKVIEYVSENDGLGYCGGTLEKEFVVFALRTIGVIQAFWGLAIFASGNTSQCFAIQLVGSASNAAALISHTKRVQYTAGLTLTMAHQSVIDVYAKSFSCVLILNFIGFMTSKSQDVPQNQKSVSRVAQVIVCTILALEMVVYLCLMADDNLFWSYATGELELDQFAPTTSASLSMIFSLGRGTMGSLGMLLLTLYPVHYAAALGALMQVSISVGDYLSKESIESNVALTDQSSVLLSVVEGGVILHATYAILLAVAFVLSSISEPPNNVKDLREPAKVPP